MCAGRAIGAGLPRYFRFLWYMGAGRTVGAGLLRWLFWRLLRGLLWRLRWWLLGWLFRYDRWLFRYNRWLLWHNRRLFGYNRWLLRYKGWLLGYFRDKRRRGWVLGDRCYLRILWNRRYLRVHRGRCHVWICLLADSRSRRASPLLSGCHWWADLLAGRYRRTLYLSGRSGFQTIQDVSLLGTFTCGFLVIRTVSFPCICHTLTAFFGNLRIAIVLCIVISGRICRHSSRGQ